MSAQTGSTVFERELRALLLDRIEHIKDELSYGRSVTDIAGFREKVGQLNGLRQAIEFCSDVEATIRKRELGE